MKSHDLICENLIEINAIAFALYEILASVENNNVQYNFQLEAHQISLKFSVKHLLFIPFPSTVYTHFVWKKIDEVTGAEYMMNIETCVCECVYIYGEKILLHYMKR